MPTIAIAMIRSSGHKTDEDGVGWGDGGVG